MRRSSQEAIRLAEEGNWGELIKRVQAAPSLAEQRDPYGMTPLHWACTEYDIPLDALTALLTAYPAGGMAPNDSQLLPLHVAIRANARVDTLSLLCTMCPDAIWAKMPDGLRALAMATMSGLDQDSLRVLQKAEAKYRYAHPDADDEDEDDDGAYEETKRDLYRQSQVMRESLRDSMLFSTHFAPMEASGHGGDGGDDHFMIQETDDEIEPETRGGSFDGGALSNLDGDGKASCGVCEKGFSMFRKRYDCSLCHMPLCKAHVAGKMARSPLDSKMPVCADCMIKAKRGTPPAPSPEPTPRPTSSSSPTLPSMAPPPPATRLVPTLSTVSLGDSSSERGGSEKLSEFDSFYLARRKGMPSPRLSERPTLSSESSDSDVYLSMLVKSLESRNAALEQRVQEQERQHNEAMLLLAQTMTRVAELELRLSGSSGDGDDGRRRRASAPFDPYVYDRHSFESSASVEFPNPYTERFSD
ncbi:Aste57867_2765 [Aphanomyces stellatus]|uniref:Aste57867_2765 protein n=1 Tax=Aphanomyces stellatus TaxID=120398 RepID=A0A485KDX5_9STRA|nr:hypothetical protein As57867_002758 [Aphanomyces stellatus]VFT79955.1 Aste57867_2765 [Aphanomyces stellatus]